jgi:hypothetical protein
MSKKPIEEIRLQVDRNRKHPPIDEHTKVPHQVRHAAALSNALVSGEPPPPDPPRPNKSRSDRSIPYTDAEIDEALQRCGRDDLKTTDPEFKTIVGLAREGARLIKAHRRGARQSREKSDSVTQRQEAVIQAFRGLSSNKQKYATGSQTISALRKAVLQKLGLQDEDGVISDDTIRQDIRQLRPIIRSIQRGTIPPSGKPNRQGLSEQTRQEMEAGKQAVARAVAAAKKS